jgi:hypothetical protein
MQNIKDLREKATIYYNSFIENKKKSKKIFKNIIIYINDNKIQLSESNKDNIKLLIHHWNNTDNYSAQDYLDMKDIDLVINDSLDSTDLSLKELFNNYLIFGEKFRKNLFDFYKYVALIEELEPSKK